MNKPKSICLAVTGASGAPYALDVLSQLLRAQVKVFLLMSSAADIVFKQELGVVLPENLADKRERLLELTNTACGEHLILCDKKDWFSPVASGSSVPDAMVVCPASGGTISAIACGASNNLIERAADVVLKERKKLVLVPREAPYSQIHLENMLKLTQMGAVILPASPGFYHEPKNIGDLVSFITARILDQVGVDQTLVARWGQGT